MPRPRPADPGRRPMGLDPRTWDRDKRLSYGHQPRPTHSGCVVTVRPTPHTPRRPRRAPSTGSTPWIRHRSVAVHQSRPVDVLGTHSACHSHQRPSSCGQRVDRVVLGPLVHELHGSDSGAPTAPVSRNTRADLRRSALSPESTGPTTNTPSTREKDTAQPPVGRCLWMVDTSSTYKHDPTATGEHLSTTRTTRRCGPMSLPRRRVTPHSAHPRRSS